MSALSHDSTGKILSTPLDSHSLAIAYNADGTINTITATDPISASVYVCTYGYTAGSPVTISAWVKQ